MDALLALLQPVTKIFLLTEVAKMFLFTCRYDCSHLLRFCLAKGPLALGTGLSDGDKKLVFFRRKDTTTLSDSVNWELFQI